MLPDGSAFAAKAVGEIVVDRGGGCRSLTERDGNLVQRMHHVAGSVYAFDIRLLPLADKNVPQIVSLDTQGSREVRSDFASKRWIDHVEGFASLWIDCHQSLKAALDG